MKKQSGTDIGLGDRCSRTAFEWAKRTFQFRKNRFGMPLESLDGAFSNVCSFGNVWIAVSSDGIGTKIEIAERTGIYGTLGFDLVAMTADDLASNGFEPANLSNILDVDYLDHDTVDKLMAGLYDACRIAGIAVTGGEIAELGQRIGGYGSGMHFNWCATCIGFLPEGLKPIDGSMVRDGDAVISLRSRGFRSNGFSLIRKIMTQTFGEVWHLEKFDDNRTWGEVLLTPSLSYSPLIVKLRASGIDIHGITHVTGGGIAGNLARVLKATGRGAILDNLHPPHDFMFRVQELGCVPVEKAYELWNMGNGMLLIAEPVEVGKILKLAGEHGIDAKNAGKVTKESGIIIYTSGAGTGNKVISYAGI